MANVDGDIEEQEQEQNNPLLVMEEKMYVAVSRDVKESKSTLLWALQNSGGRKICLLHVHQPAQMIPIMGGKFPADKLKPEEVTAFRDLERQKMIRSLNEYLLICSQVGVRAEKVEIEMDSIEKGIIELISRHEIKRLVMGAAADKHYWKKMTMLKSKKAIFVCKQAPVFCHIWFVCKGCLIHTREGSLGGTELQTTPLQVVSPTTGTAQSDRARLRSLSEGQKDHVRLTNPVQDLFRRVKSDNFDSHGGRVTALSTLEGMRAMPMLGSEGSADEWKEIPRRSPSKGSGFSIWSLSEVVEASDSIPLVRYAESEDGLIMPAVHESEEDSQYSSPPNEPVERRITDEMYDQLQQAMAETEDSKREAFEESIRRRKAERYAIDAMRKAKSSERLYTNEVKQRKEMEELLARETLVLKEMKNQQVDIMEELRTAQEQILALERKLNDSDQMVKELEEKIVSAMELLRTLKKERDEMQLERDNAVREAEDFRKRREEEKIISKCPEFFSEFSFLEIEEATSKFDTSLMIGEGGYGCVYRGYLHNTEVAIKMLHSNNLQGHSEFQQEVDVLSRVRHPNIVTLIGACPEAWALIYEYLPGGSLEDRLACKDNTPPLPWQTRTQIAIEICSALIFLHTSNPNSIVHGDLKPANVLLDANFVSKLGDFGICRLIPRDECSSGNTTPFCRTNPKGTLIYMDPEFLGTGELTPKSDVYSFGIVLLRLLTGRPAMVLVKEVQYALEKGNLNAVLDESAGNWPFVQAKQLAQLALRCCELNRRSRPDLESEVWKVLEPLKDSCRASSSFRMGDDEHSQVPPPSYFICPILQQMMREPHVAADGFTYEGEALKEWLDGGNDTSPMTNLKLAHRNLVPNHSLRSAIQEWLQQR
ncbi:Protein kinase domain [Macleaya cordata]|uniref:RING-type E3 ubiquitin transferase n=1 Tax=Macleaya cordata TaxID=56857 RepID=A0A200QU61_MACCD|nr:Protein kinase domain [Macleaya cordata]